MSAASAQQHFRAYIAEAIGTGILVLVGPGAVMVSASFHAFGQTGVALAFGVVVGMMVATFGNLSGAHINPAVTISFWSIGRFPGRSVVPYVVAQSVGAIAAAFSLRWLLGTAGAIGATIPALDLPRAFAIEAGYSAILALVILAVATDERVPRSVPPLFIGATVFAGALVTGPLTGGSFNPARSLGPAVASGLWDAHWLYWLAPITGMVAAAHAFEYLRGASAPTAVPRGIATGLEGPIERQVMNSPHQSI